MSELDPLVAELARLESAISPGQRRVLSRQIATALRVANARRIRANVDPDGEAMPPRKPQEDPGDRGKRGRMFRRVAGTGYLRRMATPLEARVGFVGRTARVMRVHQFGLRDRVSKQRGAAEIAYPERRVLGLSAEDRLRILDQVAAHLGG